MFFLNLYLQQILGYGPFESGLALLPYDTDDYGLDDNFYAQIDESFWYKEILVTGLGLMALEIAITPSPVERSYAVSESATTKIFIAYVPACLLAALGMSLAYIPILTTAISSARTEQIGLASGLLKY
jgi:hypothetical protein